MSKCEEPSFAVTRSVRDACFCLNVQRAARALARRYDEALRPVRLTNGQFSLMMALNRPEPPTIGIVSVLLAMDRTTLTANLKPLERRGLVAVMPDEKDRRRRMSLTPAGRKLLSKALPLWRRAQAATLHRLAEPADRLRAKLEALC
jgi:DNA-binding MarR family transcriptional regulator